MYKKGRPHRWQPTRLHRPWDSRSGFSSLSFPMRRPACALPGSARVNARDSAHLRTPGLRAPGRLLLQAPLAGDESQARAEWTGFAQGRTRSHVPGSLMNIPCHSAKSSPYKRPRAWGRREARRSSVAGCRGAKSAQNGEGTPCRSAWCLPAPGGRRKKRSRGQNSAQKRRERVAPSARRPARPPPSICNLIDIWRREANQYKSIDVRR